jgi:hypothetical protein
MKIERMHFFPANSGVVSRKTLDVFKKFSTIKAKWT